jgi:hypothetical protein
MIEAAKELKEILQYGFGRKELQKNYQGRNETYCNLFCKAVLNFQAATLWMPDWPFKKFHYDITSMNPGKYLNQIMRSTGTDAAYDNVLRMSKSGIHTEKTHDAILFPQAQNYPIELNEKEAYDYSNQGIPVWVTSKLTPPVGHEVIVCPTDEAYDLNRGNRIGQAGWVNGFFWMHQIFSSLWKKLESDIKYYIFPLEEPINNA